MLAVRQRTRKAKGMSFSFLVQGAMMQLYGHQNGKLLTGRSLNASFGTTGQGKLRQGVESAADHPADIFSEGEKT